MPSRNLTIVTRLGAEGFNEIYDLRLCLVAQIDQNFEWLIMLRPSAHLEFKSLVSNLKLTPTLWSKTTIVKCDTNNRSKLLNQALGAVNQGYLVVLDDDDLVMSNFVEVIRNTILITDDLSIIRTEVAKMDTKRIRVGSDYFQISTSKSENIWPTTFDRYQHLNINRTPCMAVSYPVRLLKKYGLSWDCDITAAEDWDFLMRASEVIPVESVQEITSIYRRAGGEYRSKVVVSDYQWRESEKRVRDKILLQKFTLTGGEIADLRSDGKSYLGRLYPKNFLLFRSIAIWFQPRLLNHQFLYLLSKRIYRFLIRLFKWEEYV